MPKDIVIPRRSTSASVSGLAPAMRPESVCSVTGSTRAAASPDSTRVAGPSARLRSSPCIATRPRRRRRGRLFQSRTADVLEIEEDEGNTAHLHNFFIQTFNHRMRTVDEGTNNNNCTSEHLTINHRMRTVDESTNNSNCISEHLTINISS